MIVIKNKNLLTSVRVSQLSAIAVKDRPCTFFMDSGETFRSSENLKEIEPKLPPYFMRIDRDCIINIRRIKQIDIKKREVELINGLTFGFSRRTTKPLVARFTRVPEKQ